MGTAHCCPRARTSPTLLFCLCSPALAPSFQAGVGTGTEYFRWVVDKQGRRSRLSGVASGLGRERILCAPALRWKRDTSPADPASQGREFPSKARHLGPWRPELARGRVTLQPLKERSSEARKLWTTAHTIPALPSNSGAPFLCGYLLRPRFFPDTLPAAPRAPCAHSPSLRLCAPACAGNEVRDREAALLGTPACHICTYLKLGWWSSLSGMPIAGLAAYNICID